MMPYSDHRRVTNAYSLAAETASPAVKIIMLYDGAIGRLREAKLAMAEDRIEDRFRLIGRATAIIDGLQSSLDFNNGGHVATLLDSIYGYVTLRMQQINVTNDPAICDEVIARLSELRQSWSALEDGGNQETRNNADQSPQVSAVSA